MASLIVNKPGRIVTKNVVSRSGTSEVFATLGSEVVDYFDGTYDDIVFGFGFTVSRACNFEFNTGVSNGITDVEDLAFRFWNGTTGQLLTYGVDYYNEYIPSSGQPSSVPLNTSDFYIVGTQVSPISIPVATGEWTVPYWTKKNARFSHLSDYATYTHASGQVTYENYTSDKFVPSDFTKDLPYPMSSFVPLAENGVWPNVFKMPTVRMNFVINGWAMNFSYVDDVQLVVPEEPLIYSSVSQFNITLPEEWRVPELKEWILEYAISSDNGTWSEWQTLISLPGSQFSYVHANVDVTKYYRYRYQVKQRAAVSLWSEFAQAGQPRAAVPVTLPAGGVGTTDIQDDAITAAKIADRAVKPINISNTAGDLFIFPDEVRGINLRATGTGVYFPDGSVQSTSSSGSGTVRKYSADLGAISANTALTVTHSLSSSDVIVIVYRISDKKEIDCAVEHFSTSAVKLYFVNSYVASTFRVVVMA